MTWWDRLVRLEQTVPVVRMVLTGPMVQLVLLVPQAQLDLLVPMVVAAALGAVGVAVAIPSAPGFFGTYQLAFKTVLEQFGVDSATALALGLVVWFVFWAALTLAGFIVMRTGGARLRDLTRRAQDGSPS